jgi:CelD/BcsL family acetyltransferase involved in cellulose biosynthesis
VSSADHCDLSGESVPIGDLGTEEVDAWRRLCDSDTNDRTAFLSPTFVARVGRVRPEVFVCIIRNGRVPRAFLPFQFRGSVERVLRAAEPVGAEMSDYFGLIAPPDFRICPRQLLRLARLSALTFHHLSDRQLSFGLTGEQPELGHRIVVGPDPASYWMRLSAANKGFVNELRRRERKLARSLGPLRFEFDVSDKREGLAFLIERKRWQYRETRVRDALAEAWKRDLLGVLAYTSELECSGVLSTLHAGETWVASHFGLRCGPTLHYWFPVYNEAVANAGPGHLLVKQIVDHSAAAGISVIDRGAGDQAHKSAYLTETHNYYRGYWMNSGFRSFSHRCIQAGTWRWMQWSDSRTGSAVTRSVDKRRSP